MKTILKKIYTFSIILLLVLLMGNVGRMSHLNQINAQSIVESKGELRAAWITPLTGEVATYTTEQAFKNDMNQILDMLEYYNFNAVIFHIRTHNNALYNSSLNPIASWFSNVNFNSFDPLDWLITETHKRGLEFHAWLNPYRLSTTYVPSAYPVTNPASDSTNVLTQIGSTSIRILDPGLPNVREFITETILEILNQYDVDAIHFDDYFYTNLGANGALSGTTTILDEPDQQTFIDYAGSYNTSSAADKADWRRDQVNLMVQSVSDTIKNFNQTNNKQVQFGISPTGIYQNGNGVVTYDSNGNPITTGSSTGGQTHYASYLFADSVKWLTEGWLDYILPQSYWATNHPVASYYEVMGWWDKVVKNLNVNLYSGIGLYMADSASETHNWKSNTSELTTQLNYLNNLENASGLSIYSLQYMTKAYNGVSSVSATQLTNAFNSSLTTKKVLPEIKSMTPTVLSKVSNLRHENGILSFDSVSNAKQYYIYKSNSLTYNDSEIVKIIGRNETGTITYQTNDMSDDYEYGVRVLSYTNHLSEPAATDSNIKTIDGASIRTQTEVSSQGLRFYGQLDLETVVDSQGFYLIFGEANVTDLEQALELDPNNLIINGKKVFKKEIESIDPNGTFSVVLTGIPEEGYIDKITAVAYYVVSDVTYLSPVSTTRSIGQVAIKMENSSETNQASSDIINHLLLTTKRLELDAFGSYSIVGLYENNHFNLRSEFIKDWNAKFGTTWTTLTRNEFYSNAILGKDTDPASLRNSRIDLFFNDPIYKIKWDWILDYFISVDSVVWATRQITAIRGDGTFSGQSNIFEGKHLIFSLLNFFNQTHEEDGYPANNFSVRDKYLSLINFNQSILVQHDNYNFIKIGSTINLPEPPSGAGVFSHYLINGVTYSPNDLFLVNENVIIQPIYN